MKITISGKPKEIAALALELQRQHEKSNQNNDAIKRQIDMVSNASKHF